MSGLAFVGGPASKNGSASDHAGSPSAATDGFSTGLGLHDGRDDRFSTGLGLRDDQESAFAENGVEFLRQSQSIVDCDVIRHQENAWISTAAILDDFRGRNTGSVVDRGASSNRATPGIFHDYGTQAREKVAVDVLDALRRFSQGGGAGPVHPWATKQSNQSRGSILSLATDDGLPRHSTDRGLLGLTRPGTLSNAWETGIRPTGQPVVSDVAPLMGIRTEPSFPTSFNFGSVHFGPPMKKVAPVQTVWCDRCNRTLNKKDWESHCAGYKHRMADPSQIVNCEVCDLTLRKHCWETHIAGHKHKMKTKERENPTKAPEGPPGPRQHISFGDLLPKKTSYNNESVQPVGEEFLTKEDKEENRGKQALYSCKLCGLDGKILEGCISDHLRSQYHRSQYKAEVDPDYEIEPTPREIAHMQIMILGNCDHDIVFKFNQLIANMVDIEKIIVPIEESMRELSSVLTCSDNREKTESCILEGPVRVGPLGKNTLFTTDKQLELVLLCIETPSKTQLIRYIHAFQQKLQAQSTISCEIYLDTIGKAIVVEVLKPVQLRVRIYFSLPVAEWPSSSETGTTGPTSVGGSFDGVREVRRTKWIQENAMKKSCRIVLAIFRDLVQRVPKWNVPDIWPLEIIVCNAYALADSTVGFAYLPSDGLLNSMEILASGILLPGGPGISDPLKNCTDAAESWSPQQREDVTAEAQNAVRQIQMHRMHRLLGTAEKVFARKKRNNKAANLGGADKEEESKKIKAEEVQGPKDVEKDIGEDGIQMSEVVEEQPNDENGISNQMVKTEFQRNP